jgi:hypothetical protein
MRKADKQAKTLSESNSRDAVVHVYFTDEEKARVTQRAKRKGLSTAAYLRALALDDLSNKDRPVSPH